MKIFKNGDHRKDDVRAVNHLSIYISLLLITIVPCINIGFFFFRTTLSGYFKKLKIQKQYDVKIQAQIIDATREITGSTNKFYQTFVYNYNGDHYETKICVSSYEEMSDEVSESFLNQYCGEVGKTMEILIDRSDPNNISRAVLNKKAKVNFAKNLLIGLGIMSIPVLFIIGIVKNLKQLNEDNTESTYKADETVLLNEEKYKEAGIFDHVKYLLIFKPRIIVIVLGLMLFFVISVWLIGCGIIGQYKLEHSKKVCTELVQGELLYHEVKVEERDGRETTYYFPVFGYSYNNKEYTYKGNASYTRKEFEEGEQVDIYVDPDNPDTVYIPGYKLKNKGYLGNIIVGAVIIGFIYICIKLKRA